MAFLQAMLDKISFRAVDHVEPEFARENISEKIHRFMPLYRLQEQKQFIEVVSETTGETFQSLILGIDLVNEQIDLDELFPAPQFAVAPGDRFTIQHHRDGKVIAFTSTLEAVEHGLDGQIFTFELPETLVHRQRRRYSRVNMSQQQPLTARLQSPWRTPWFATIKNLSANGMRVTVGGNALDQLRPGAIIPQCEFEFNADFKFRCQARVRAFKFVRRPYRHTEISVQFLDLPPTQVRTLDEFLRTLVQHEKEAA